MATLEELKQFDFARATPTLWTFKARVPTGEPPIYTGRWVDITEDVVKSVREIAGNVVGRLEEVLEYDLLAENNEASALTIPAIETHAGLITTAAASELDEKKTKKLKEIQNSEFYSIKFVLGNSILHAIKKTDSSWKAKTAKNKNHMFFRDEQLTLETDPHFEIVNALDLIVFDDTVFSIHKGRSESVLRYKQAHKDDFTNLQADAEFANIFSDMQPLISFVGENKTRLRRVSAIKQKAHFKDPGFMTRLRTLHTNYKLRIEYDQDGKIRATDETAADIVTALLDHRLGSGFSEEIYDVQNTTKV